MEATKARTYSNPPALAPKQEMVLSESTARMNIAWGPVRSGKTVGLEIWRWFEYCCTAPEGDLLMSGKTLKTLERNVLRPMKNTFGPVVDYSLGKKEAYVHGRRIELEGANDEKSQDKVQGMTLAGALINELTLVPESFFKQVLARMSVRGAKLFGSTNPDSPYHWLKTDFLEREGDLNLRQWQFKLDDNIFLDPDYVEALKAEYTGIWYKRFILGLWVLAAGAIYSMFDEDVHMRPLPKEKLKKVSRFIVDVDYGTSNPTTFSLKGIWHEDGKPFAHTFKEYYYDGREEGQKTDQEFAEDMGEWLPERIGDKPVGRPTAYCDPSAASFIQALKRKRNVYVKEADNDVIDGIRFVSSMLADGRYTIDPECKETAKEYMSYVWDERAQKRGEDKPLKQNDHTCDRDRYGLYTHLGTNTRTQTPQVVTL